MVERVMTLDEVAETLRVHEQTVRRLLKRGALRGFKVGDCWRVEAEAVREFIRAAAPKFKEGV